MTPGGPDRIQTCQEPYQTRGVTADIVGQLSISQGFIQPGGVDGPHGEEAQDPGAGADIPQDADAVPGVGRSKWDLVCGGCRLQFLPQLPVRLGKELKVQIPGPQQLLVLRFPQIQAVAIDEVLDRRVDQIGDIPPQVDILPDPGGADILQMSGQLQLDHVAADAAQIRVDLPALGVTDTAEDDVVQGVNRSG